MSSNGGDGDNIISFPKQPTTGELGKGLAHLRDDMGLPPGQGEEYKAPELSVKLPIQKLMTRVTELLKASDGRHGLYRRGDDVGVIDAETGGFVVMTPKWFRTWFPKNRGVFLKDGEFKVKDEETGETKIIPREGDLTKDQCETLLIRGGELWLKLPVIRGVHPVKLPVVVSESGEEGLPMKELRGRRPLRLLQPGYDPRTGIWTSQSGPDFDPDMTIHHGVALLHRWFHTFGWRNEPRDMAIHIAALLTMFCRGLFEGKAPMFVYNANKRKSGKSVLASLVGWVTTGSRAIMALQPDAEEALEKRLFAVANSGKTFVNFDNVDWKGKKIESATLDQWITGAEVENQKFFTQDIVSKVVSSVTVMSGNTLEFSEDLDRRSLIIDLLNHLPVSETRPPKDAVVLDESFFMTSENRRQLLSALWSIVREWDKAGMPKGPIAEHGSFEDWSRVIPHIVWFAGEATGVGAWDCMMPNANAEVGDKDTRDFRQVCEMALSEFGKDDHANMKQSFEITVAQLAGVARRHGKCSRFLYPVATIEDVLATEGQRGGWSYKEPDDIVLGAEKDALRERQASEHLCSKTRAKFGIALKDRIHENWFRGPDGKWYQFDHLPDRTPAAYYVERSSQR